MTGDETQVCSLWSSVIISISQDIAALGLSFPSPWPHKCDIKQKVNTRSEEERYFINNENQSSLTAASPFGGHSI